MYQSAIFGVAFFAVVGILVAFRKRGDAAFLLFMKALVLFFCAVGFFRFMLSDSFIYVINDAYLNGVHYDATDPLQTFLRWGYYLNYAVLPMAVFFDSRLFKNIALLFCLPMSILSVVYFHDFMRYFLEPITGRGLMLAPWFRYSYFVLELVLALIIPLVLCIRTRHFIRLADGSERARFLIALPSIFLLMMPVYVPQSLFGYTALSAKIGSLYHFAWIGILRLVTLSLYYIFRFRSERERYMLCIFLTIVLFFHYDSLYLMGFSIKRLPIQLCNLASYFYMIAIPFRLRRMFNFCFIANLVGTLIAILLPDFMPGAMGFWNMHFILEHSLVLMIPALVMGLRIFPRIDRRALLHTAVGFNLYFAFCFTLGLVFNAYVSKDGTVINYFFIFDIDKAIDYFSFLRILENVSFTVNGFAVYPILIGIIYVVFSLSCFLFYFLIKYLYTVEDDHLALREASIDLYERITSKKSRRPHNFCD